ncbi:MAG TPA: hypothetical protein VK395_06175 [Gemmataceae bacterium]|nr:hypothetical protein [Gemmataceae bacterium]
MITPAVSTMILYSRVRKILSDPTPYRSVLPINASRLALQVIHLRATYMPIGPDTFGQRLEAAGFAEVAIKRGRAPFHFRAVR